MLWVMYLLYNAHLVYFSFFPSYYDAQMYFLIDGQNVDLLSLGKDWKDKTQENLLFSPIVMKLKIIKGYNTAKILFSHTKILCITV